MVTSLKERLTTLLVQGKLLTQEKLKKELKVQKEKKGRLGDVLVELGYISRDNLLEVGLGQGRVFEGHIEDALRLESVLNRILGDLMEQTGLPDPPCPAQDNGPLQVRLSHEALNLVVGETPEFRSEILWNVAGLPPSILAAQHF